MSLSQIVYDGVTGPNPPSWLNLQANKVYCNEIDILGNNLDFEEINVTVNLSTYTSAGAIVDTDFAQKSIKFLRIGEFIQVYIPAFSHTAGAVYNYVAFNIPTDLIPLNSKVCPIIAELNSTVENSIAVPDVGGKFRFYKNLARQNFAISDLYDVSSQTLIYNLYFFRS